jgi:hypothetical protein
LLGAIKSRIVRVVPIELVAAAIAAATSVLVVLLGHWVTSRTDRNRRRADEVDEVNRRYLNPLRLQVAEASVRIAEYAQRAEQRMLAPGQRAVPSAADVSGKTAEWFVGEGAYLVSTSYITCCLFAEMGRLRENYAYLRLAGEDADTRVAGLLLRVNLAFLHDQGIYYVLQYSAGRDMIRDDGLLVGYREFCSLLMNPDMRVWLDRILGFYLDSDSGTDRAVRRLHLAVEALGELSAALDSAVGGSESMTARYAAETRDSAS